MLLLDLCHVGPDERLLDRDRAVDCREEAASERAGRVGRTPSLLDELRGSGGLVTRLIGLAEIENSHGHQQ